ncbi:hypothetical protein SLW70_09840 [Flavobacterium sp. NG2]|uniref:hypothetical protein n=1 Tax=Flavobacterium sp. NG2 TaxID=3097547 RepID=UPI002A81B483|nr:hypothetical protein [Flavobacterium sp. NG2]WPR70245.1 hypothetical protein SLW70_09840 [Flavobacterium sp. NG2]
MKNFLLFRLTHYTICLIFIIGSLVSCNKKGKDFTESIFGTTTDEIESTIDFNLINYLSKSNTKIIDITALAVKHSNDKNKRQLLLKIKRDHQDIELELKELTQKNLIIVPKSIYTLNSKADSLQGQNAEVYLSQWLINEIKNQLSQFDSIETTSKNTDFVQFAVRSKLTLKQNIIALNTSLSK